MKPRICQVYQMNTQPTIWQKASILGSVWGAFEIVAGSMLHNLAIPMVAGTILSTLGVIILVAGAKVFGGKGLFWRSALVCAALKTVSPSPVILTPMIGITLEGVLLESGVLLLGHNVAGYILGGSFALLSILGFKLVRLIMIYGTDLVEAYKSVFSFAFSNDFIASKGYLIPIFLLIIIYSAIGAFAAYTGLRGGNIISKRFKSKNIQFLPPNNQYKPKEMVGYKGGIGFLAFHIVWLIAFIFSKNYIPNIYWVTGGIIYLTLCIFRYGRVRKLLSKLSFWVVILIVSTSSSIFILLGKYSTILWSYELIEQISTIFIRASVVIISFTCISIEMMSKGVSRHLQGNRFSQLAQSYTHAHSALPSLLSTLKTNRQKFHRPLPIIEKMFAHFTYHNTNHPINSKIIIITADKQSGKTTFLKELVALLEKKNQQVWGFFAEGLWNDNGERTGFNLITLPAKSSIPLCNKTTTQWQPFGSYFFNPKAIEQGTAHLENAPSGVPIFIDEVGLFELDDQIWANAFSNIISKRDNPIIVTIRRAFLEQSKNKWELNGATIVDATTDCPEDTVKTILENLK
ncbi:MAG: nucleoside-triphosphatase [Perlabentimonas sp.]